VGARDTALPPEERAREICLAALERRMRSRHELEQILRRKGVRLEVAGPVLDRLTEVGLVDDAAFARAFVASRQRTRPRGTLGLAAELRRRGIDAGIIEDVLGELCAAEEPVEAARRAVASKLRSLAGRPPDEVRRKAEQFLLRRGFGFETAREALRDLPGDDP
jgi:regulatory protein